MKKILSVFIFVHLWTILIFAQTVPAPKDVIGFTPGDDRKLASWNQILEYFQKLEDTSPRVKFEAIGKTTMDKPFVYATISTPENLKNLEKYKEINKKLADPRLIKSNDKLAQSLIKQGKTIVLITFGIHSTEVGSTLSSMLVAHRLATSNEPEIKKVLENTIILLVPSLNPDGVDIVKNWYDKTLGTPYEGSNPPELYHKYIGHDNNRDWYAFTQVETQMTVDKIHNVWHPQIVNDIHQQGAFGARNFFPPYMPPVEPNVPKEIVEGYTELGTHIADGMRKDGFAGITTNSSYDAWTPARAYSHYHGGVRILSETASARLASPINVTFEQLRGDDGYDAKVESKNFAPVWKGGEWKLRDITNYMTGGIFHLLNHASDNREKWLNRFYAIGKEAVRPRKNGELQGFLLPVSKNRGDLLYDLDRAGVEYKTVNKFSYNGKIYERETVFIELSQPYGSFAKALLETQNYPNLLDDKGNPIAPYDVTAHSVSLMVGAEAIPVYEKLDLSKVPEVGKTLGIAGCFTSEIMLAIYKSNIPSMDEGWTRWILGEETLQHRREHYRPCIKYGHNSVTDSDIKNNKMKTYIRKSNESDKLGFIIFPDQTPNQMLNGHAKNSMPEEFTGGIGKDGVANLKKFVEDGGTLVFLNRASDFAIEQFNLPIKDVTDNLPRKEFYIPGSILRTNLDTNHPIAKGMPKDSIAWFENSPTFEVLDKTNVEVIAKYPDNPKDVLLSGWAFGLEKIAGKAALVQVKMGKGKIILFGFRPQYRGQSLATFPLLFNAISGN